MKNSLALLSTIDISDINNWFDKQYSKTPRTPYASVDIRDDGNRIIPIDTNLFPAGFNNVDDSEIDKIALEVTKFIESNFFNAKTVGIIVENNTRNEGYFAHLRKLNEIFGQTKYKHFFINTQIKEPFNINPANENIVIYPVQLENKYLFVNGEKCDFLLSNNDFSSGVPQSLKDIKQNIVPNISSGWFSRKKSDNFMSYEEAITEFCNYFGLDKFYFSAAYSKCGEINFKEKKGLDCIANNVDKMIHRLKNTYLQKNIDQQPYVFVKAERGTYGMGIMNFHSADEVYLMNKNIRKKMDVIKGGIKNTSVVIQEGIASNIQYKESAAEPLIYTVNSEVISMILRYNPKKTNLTNLNSSGINFVNFKKANENLNKRRKLYDIIARVAVLAAAKELS